MAQKKKKFFWLSGFCCCYQWIISIVIVMNSIDVETKTKERERERERANCRLVWNKVKEKHNGEIEIVSKWFFGILFYFLNKFILRLYFFYGCTHKVCMFYRLQFQGHLSMERKKIKSFHKKKIKSQQIKSVDQFFSSFALILQFWSHIWRSLFFFPQSLSNFNCKNKIYKKKKKNLWRLSVMWWDFWGLRPVVSRCISISWTCLRSFERAVVFNPLLFHPSKKMKKKKSRISSSFFTTDFFFFVFLVFLNPPAVGWALRFTVDWFDYTNAHSIISHVSFIFIFWWKLSSIFNLLLFPYLTDGRYRWPVSGSIQLLWPSPDSWIVLHPSLPSTLLSDVPKSSQPNCQRRSKHEQQPDRQKVYNKKEEEEENQEDKTSSNSHQLFRLSSSSTQIVIFSKQTNHAIFFLFPPNWKIPFFPVKIFFFFRFILFFFKISHTHWPTDPFLVFRQDYNSNVVYIKNHLLSSWLYI